MHQINRVLRVLRAMHGLTQCAMAEKVGLSEEHYGDLERGKASPGACALRKISEATGVSMEAIWVMNTSAPKELDREYKMLWNRVQEYLMAKFVTKGIVGGYIKD